MKQQGTVFWVACVPCNACSVTCCVPACRLFTSNSFVQENAGEHCHKMATCCRHYWSRNR